MIKLRVSPNHRFLIYDDGTPFFWLGDTAWELFHRSTLEMAEEYLEKRRRQGFNVLQAVVLAEMDGLRVPNAYGALPLHQLDPRQPNEDYFRYVDQVIELAGKKGLFIGLLPTWGDKLETLHFGKGPVVFNPETAFLYGQWIGRRYREVWNIIWINGGDRQGGGDNFRIWDALGRGIKSVDPNHLMTFHPPGGGDGRSSSEWFHEVDWLDFNLAQSGHVRKHLPNYEIISHDYHLLPIKPCLDGEPRYEDHGVNWKPDELGWFDDYDVRQAAYWALFSGAFGHTYGCHAVWQWCSEGYEPVNWPRRYWRQALDLPGANQMRYLWTLIESRPMLCRRPDQSLLRTAHTDAYHQRACRGDDYLFVYLPRGGSVELELASFPGSRCKVHWFDPRTGISTMAGAYDRLAQMEFTAPAQGPCNDWILVLDDARANYRSPGALPCRSEVTKKLPGPG
jgi:hypothetical protein